MNQDQIEPAGPTEADTSLDCFDLERIIWTDGPEAIPPEHLAACASCRAEARRAADLKAALSGLGMRVAVPPTDLETAIMAAVTRSRLDRARDIVSHPKFWRGAAVGAAAAATAAVGLLVARRLAKPEPSLVA